MIDDDAFDARTYGLLSAFDSLGFVPTTLTPDPEKTAKEWKENLIAVITELYKMNDCLNKRVMELEQEVIHADEKVFYREINVKLSEDKIKAEAVKEFAEKLKSRLCEWVNENEDDDEYDISNIRSSAFYSDVIGITAKDGTIISAGLIDKLVEETEK